jgi:peptidoglycan/xylan/chitin deacetylase (PgdA/CDA1 family)
MIGKRELAASVLDRAPIRPTLRRLPLWSGLLVLNYHRIGDPAASELDRDLFSATVEAFDRQCAFLARELEVVGLDDFDACLRRPGRHVMLTFDDGYRDNYELAFPILQRHRLPATFFLATGFIDRPRLAWWDEIAWMARHARVEALPPGTWSGEPLPLDPANLDGSIRSLLRHYKGLPTADTPAFLDEIARLTRAGRFAGDAKALWMTWDMIRELREAGMSIGAHTVDHPLLARLPVESQAAEIARSRDRIAEELGETPRAFAYPVGKPGTFTADTQRLLAEQGFQCGFAFSGGYLASSQFDRFAISRAHVGHGLSDAGFRATIRLPQIFVR